MDEKNKINTFLKNLLSAVTEISEFVTPNTEFYNMLLKDTSSVFSIKKINDLSKKIKPKLKDDFLSVDVNDYNDIFYKKLRLFIDSELNLFVDITNSFLRKILTLFGEEVFNKNNWETTNPVTLFSAAVMLLQYHYRSLKNIINKYFITGFEPNIELKVIDDSNKIWKTAGMQFKEFESDITKLKEYTNELLADIKTDYIDDMIFRLQVSEFIKNAIRHGNNLDKTKKVKVWYKITPDYAKFIFEDEGKGFQNLEEWNEFNRKRLDFLSKQDITNALKYATFKTEHSVENDGGNFLFSALEYWDSGVIFNSKRNRIYVMKYFY